MLKFIYETGRGAVVAAFWVSVAYAISHFTGSDAQMAIAITALVLAIRKGEVD